MKSKLERLLITGAAGALGAHCRQNVGHLAQILRVSDRLEITTKGSATQNGTEEIITKRLEEIKGIVPSLHDLPVGCAFSNRCSYVMEKCIKEDPVFEEKSKKHWASCFKDFK